MRKQRSERQKTIKRLEVLFSQYIRIKAIKESGGCERCGRVKDSWKDLDCAHFFDDRIYATKFHELNAAGICGGCHFYLDSHAVEKVVFFGKRMTPTELGALTIMAGLSSRSAPIDCKLTEIYLRQKIREISR